MPIPLWLIDSGGQHYDGLTANQKWTEYGVIGVVPNGPSQDDGYIECFSAGTAITLDFNAQAIWVGGRFRFVNTVGGGSFVDGVDILHLVDDFTGQISARVRSDGRISIRRGVTEVFVSNFSLQLNIFYYIELRAFISNEGGSAEVRVGEVTVATFAGDTQESANAFATQVAFVGQIPSGLRVHMRDLYVHTLDFVGDVNIGIIRSNGTGALQDFAPVGAPSAWEANDDIPPDGDTSYIHSNVVGHQYCHEMEDVTLTGVCKGIQLLNSVRKDDSNVRKMKPLLRQSGGNSLGPELSIPVSFIYSRWCMEKSPFTSAFYTEAELDAIQAGGELTG